MVKLTDAEAKMVVGGTEHPWDADVVVTQEKTKDHPWGGDLYDEHPWDEE